MVSFFVSVLKKIVIKETTCVGLGTFGYLLGRAGADEVAAFFSAFGA
jgi:hypothetical protein